MSGPTWLSGRDSRGNFVFALDEARERYEARKLPGGWLVLNRETDLWLKFAVLEFCESAADRTDELDTCVFHGEGTLGDLRECRHTWWGEDGYCFYLNGPLVTAALRELSEFFDGMVEKPSEGGSDERR
jgi:hypothetical protein